MQNTSQGERLSLVALMRKLWTIIWNTLIEFVWSDLRDGMIDLHGLTRPVRVILSLGIFTTAVGLFLLTQTPSLRSSFPLYTSITPAPGRGLHIPLFLFPFSLFLLTLAWAYLLVGARHSHWLIRFAVIFLYTLAVANWLVPLLTTNLLEVAFATVLYGIILLTYLIPQAKKLPPAFYFSLNLVCAGTIFVITQSLLLQQDEASGLPIGKTLLESNLRSLATLAIPLLILIGIDIADFTIHAATWVRQAATSLLTTKLLGGLTFVLLGWLLWGGLNDFAWRTDEAIQVPEFYPLLGVSTLLGLLWLCWSLMARLFPDQRLVTIETYSLSVGRVALSLVVAILLPLLTSFLFLEIAQLLESIAVELDTGFYGNFPAFATWASHIYVGATSLSGTFYDFQTQWQTLCASAAILIALLLYHRKHPAPALFAITFGINYLFVELTRPGRWLQNFGWSSIEPFVFAWAILLLVWTIVKQWQRQFLPRRISNLMLACLILLLLSQTNLIASPLDPLFALAGVGYLAVGLGWDLVTAGSWTNNESPSLPRIARLFLYIGYILLTVMLINWAVATHDFTLLSRFTGEAALTGLALLGYPYLFSALYLLLTHEPRSADGS